MEFCSDGHKESGGLADANMLFRGPKLAKIFRIIRLLRMIKLIKLMKNAEHLQSTFQTGMKINSGFERLSLMMGGVLYLQHLLACVWIVIGQEEFLFSRDGWITNNLYNKGGAHTYISAFYFIVSTMTTVGYGDFSAGTTNEKVFCILLMVGGVFIFSTITGSIAAILA